jgi:hypothetical protein
LERSKSERIGHSDKKSEGVLLPKALEFRPEIGKEDFGLVLNWCKSYSHLPDAFNLASDPKIIGCKDPAVRKSRQIQILVQLADPKSVVPVISYFGLGILANPSLITREKFQIVKDKILQRLNTNPELTAHVTACETPDMLANFADREKHKLDAKLEETKNSTATKNSFTRRNYPIEALSAEAERACKVLGINCPMNTMDLDRVMRPHLENPDLLEFAFKARHRSEREQILEVCRDFDHTFSAAILNVIDFNAGDSGSLCETWGDWAMDNPNHAAVEVLMRKERFVKNNRARLFRWNSKGENRNTLLGRAIDASTIEMVPDQNQLPS